MTNNDRRKIDQIETANLRFANTAGHIMELTPPGGEGNDADHAATDFAWSFFIIAGDSTWGSTQSGRGTSKNGWFFDPDNVAFDPKGTHLDRYRSGRCVEEVRN